MTKDQIVQAESVKVYFESHPQSDKGFFTSDGMPFHGTKLGKLSAETHARSNKLECFEITRAEALKETEGGESADKGGADAKTEKGKSADAK